MPDPLAAQGEEEPRPAADSETKDHSAADHVTEPSTEKEPGEEAKAPPGREEEEPSHEAVGIGVLDASGDMKQVTE